MKKIYLHIRSLVLWVISSVHFFIGGALLVLLAIFIDPRKTDVLQRTFARNILRLAGARLEVRYAPGFDRKRTSIFISNHVNIFDPFVVYSSVPQFVRGWELEDHFRVPVYGWMMKRFGNVPVSSRRTAADLKNLLRRTKAALDDGVSLVVFAEGGRTIDGRVRPFQDGIFRMLRQLQYPIVPMSIVGAFEFHRKGGRVLYPSKIVVYLHDTIDVGGMALDKEAAETLRDKVHSIVSAPIDAAMNMRQSPEENAPVSMHGDLA
ncbi:MAG: 1-acyl-sn-glycerol-3-phosphate acyltransferase [Acidobacteria bacterium]|nr:1-acyl-sn-glycerol-3-phosphate acyltransferase [Acidobacteriota bacterium]